MKPEKFILICLFLGIVLTAVSTIRFETYLIPDLGGTKYGFPLFWLDHQTNSLGGAVDIWSVQWPFLLADFALWCVISISIIYSINRYQS